MKILQLVAVLLNLIYVTTCEVERMMKLIDFPKNQIRRICKLLANFFICDYSNFKCLESYQLCTLQYCGTDFRTALYILHYSSTTGAPEGQTSI